MARLIDRRIIIGITGGIAAYKSAELVRRLKDEGAQVRVVMTPAAREFITPLTLQAVSGNSVHLSLLDTDAEAAMGHIELARWGEMMLVAPATADFIARLSHGHANDLLTTLCLAATCPIALAPAMNQAMWANAANQANIHLLRQRQITLIGPASGSQACGDVGPGRMVEPAELVSTAVGQLADGPLTGQRVLITAGPTREAIDPVRYISNHSSGKMGYALAQAARDLGAEVTLISGPVSLACPPGIERINVTSARDMLEAVMAALPADIFIGTAAVADYRPEGSADHKLKKEDGNAGLALKLVENPDIIATVARQTPKPFTVGFAAETRDVVTYAKRKIQRKNLDLIVANDVSRQDIGFNSEMNAVTVISPRQTKALELASKAEIARQILTEIIDHAQL